MDEKKRQVVEQGDSQGEAYAKAMYEREGIAALREKHDWMDLCVREELYKGVPFMQQKAFVQSFARGAQRFSHALIKGFDDESKPYPEGFDMTHCIAELRKHRRDLVDRAEADFSAARPGGSHDDLCRHVIDYIDERAMGDRPTLIAAYRAGKALAQKGV